MKRGAIPILTPKGSSSSKHKGHVREDEKVPPPRALQMEVIVPTRVNTLMPEGLTIICLTVSHSLTSLFFFPITKALSLSSVYTVGIIYEAFTIHQALS